MTGLEFGPGAGPDPGRPLNFNPFSFGRTEKESLSTNSPFLPCPFSSSPFSICGNTISLFFFDFLHARSLGKTYCWNAISGSGCGAIGSIYRSLAMRHGQVLARPCVRLRLEVLAQIGPEAQESPWFKTKTIGVLFGCFGRKIDGPGLRLIIYQGHLFPVKRTPMTKTLSGQRKGFQFLARCLC